VLSDRADGGEPFSLALGANPHAVRLRREFRAVLDLVRAHGMLHQAGRE